MGRRSRRWIQSAIKRPGRVRRYIRRLYGKKAFTKDGDIKVAYLRKAIRHVKEEVSGSRRRSLLSALYLALRLREMAKK